MFLGFGGDGYAVAGGVGADVEGVAFDGPDPVCEGPVEEGVERDGDGGVVFCGLEAVGVVPVETGSADGEGEVADCEAGVGEGVGLLEAEGVEVGGYYIVGGVFEVWWVLVGGLGLGIGW